MTQTQSTVRPSNDTAWAAIILGAAGLIGALWAGGALAIVIAGEHPHGGLFAGVEAFAHTGQPAGAWGEAAPGPTIYWAVTAVIVGIAIALVVAARRLFATSSSPTSVDVFRLPGTASKREIRHACSPRAVRKRGRHLRPSIHKPEAHDVGFRIGVARGIEAWTSVEDSVVVLGAARSGKDRYLVVNVILDAPGAVISTSTRPDNIHQTIEARKTLGPVAVFDPQHLAGDMQVGLRWSLTRGCDKPMTAMIRAAGLAAGTGKGAEDGGFWQGQTEAALRALLMAAALDHRGAADLYRWSLTPAAVQDAIAILDTHPRAPAGWATALNAVADSDPRQRDSVWLGVRQSLAALGDPDVLAAVSPAPGEQFDPAAFIQDCGTLYLVGTATGAGAAANLVAAFIEDIVETARHLAAASPGARLDPPITMMLNEIGNLSPLPSLPTLMSEGGGTGICTWAILQSLAQARHKWGEQAAATLWDASTTKIILGGGSDAGDLRDLVFVVGDRDEITWAESRGYDGQRSRSSSLRRIPILDSGRLRTLPDGAAMLLLRSVPPAVIRMRRWTDRTGARHRSQRRSARCNSDEIHAAFTRNVDNSVMRVHDGQTSIVGGEVTKR
ncbi:MAG: type IV secretory system conjugative DNA transfer family protein [Actinobacteria bacterium]|nr:type IV secretory system conjugative DNA transfer family protein [Actinomycetota bacterium]